MVRPTVGRCVCEAYLTSPVKTTPGRPAPSVSGTLGRKINDRTVRPGNSANNSARAGGMNLIATTGSGSVARTVTSSRGAM